MRCHASSRAHSERLWKQLVDRADTAEEPANDLRRSEIRRVFGLAVAAALAVRSALFGLRAQPADEVPPFDFRNASLSSFRCSPSTSCGSAGGMLERPLARCPLRPGPCSPTFTLWEADGLDDSARAATLRC